MQRDCAKIDTCPIAKDVPNLCTQDCVGYAKYESSNFGTTPNKKNKKLSNSFDDDINDSSFFGST